jgi:hypothetical protein
MKIIDNFLTKEEWFKLFDTMLTANFPWYLNSSKVGKHYGDDIGLHDYQFTHTFYSDFAVRSQFGSLIEPALVKLNPSAIVRVKANLTPCSQQIEQFPMHRDFENFQGQTAIFYLNTNNGYTVFKDGTRVDSVANRCVIFDSQLEHTGTTCTDQRVRSVINFNYYPWTEQ